MKLVIQIPCYNEEKTLAVVLKEIPKEIKGISSIKTMIIDDGSHDKTIEIAKKHNVDYIVEHI
jgi:glycosyltransferase involved in cell wall biosynthesis